MLKILYVARFIVLALVVVGVVSQALHLQGSLLWEVYFSPSSIKTYVILGLSFESIYWILKYRALQTKTSVK